MAVRLSRPFPAPGGVSLHSWSGISHLSRRGEKSSTQGDVRSSGQGHKTFLTWGEGYARLSRAVRIWPTYARTPLRPSIPAGWPFISTHFRYVFGLFCNLFLGMTKPPQRTYASRQRADTRFSPLSWTHPIRAEAGFGIFRGGGWRTTVAPGYPEKLMFSIAPPGFLWWNQKIVYDYKP